MELVMKPFIVIYHIVRYLLLSPKRILSYASTGFNATVDKLSRGKIKTKKEKKPKDEVESAVLEMEALMQKEKEKAGKDKLTKEPVISFRYKIKGSNGKIINGTFEGPSADEVKVFLKNEGYEIVLVNSNPATIMTDPEFADRTYIEPLSADILHEIIRRERPDAILPTLGGQTALNLAVELYDKGILKRYGVEMIGASVKSINKAEDRQLFKKTMKEIGLDLPRFFHLFPLF